MKYILQVFTLICICITSLAQTEGENESYKIDKVGGIEFDEFLKLSKKEKWKIISKKEKIPKNNKSFNPLNIYKLIVHIPSGEYTTLIPSNILFEPESIGKGNLKIVKQSSFKLKKLIDRNKFFDKYKNDLNLIFIEKHIKIEKNTEKFKNLNKLGKYVISKKNK